MLRVNNLIGFGSMTAVAATPWTPAAITTAWWLDADDSATITQSGGLVSQWNDKSGNAIHVSQATSGSRPTISAAALNGNDVLTFDGGDRLFTDTDSNLLRNVGSALSAVVRKISGTGTTQVMFDVSTATDTNTRYQMYTLNTAKSGLGGRTTDAGGTTFINSTNNASTTSYQIQVGAIDYTNSNGDQYIDGTQDGTTTTFNTDGSTSNTVASRCCVGATLTDTLRLSTGGIAEIVIVHGDISTGTRQKLEGYLAHKWGLTGSLPGGHPYKTNAPTV
jgi:hypothetical protein